MSDGPVPIALTLGALLVGGSVALVLSGMVSVQCIIFFKLYPDEVRVRIATVIFVWILDLLHSICVVASLFNYFINFFGDRRDIDYIPWSIALTVVVTAIMTLIVHMHYAQKIFISSRRNWAITIPIVILAFLRLFAASVSTTEMIRLQRYSAFNEKYPGWVFTTGLSLSAGVDVIITGWLCYFLRKMRGRTASTPMAHVVDMLTLYTLENGLLTCLAVIASLICWITMPNNLVFLGLHFVIGKLYANSMLISLNTRKELREMRWGKSQWDPTLPALAHDDFSVPNLYRTSTGLPPVSMKPAGSAYRPAFKVTAAALPLSQPLQVNVQRTVARSSDDLTDVLHRDFSYEGGQRYHWHRPQSPLHNTSEQLHSLP